MLSRKKSFALFILMVSSSSKMLVLFNLIVFAKPYILITSPHILIGLGLGSILLHQGIAKLWRMTKTDLNLEEIKKI